MSDDFKAAFRAAQAQRGLAAKPSKEQLKALKAKKASTAAAAGVSSTAPGAKQQLATAPRTSAALGASKGTGGAAALPSDFFDQGKPQPAASRALQPNDTPQQPPPAQQQLAGTKRPAASIHLEGGQAALPAAPAAAGADASAVPKGFFDDKQADNVARGIKAPDKKDKEAAFAEFAAAMDDQLKEQAAAEDNEAEAAAQEREEREEYEQQMRVQRAAALRTLRQQPTAAKEQIQLDADIAAAAAAAGKKRRVVDVLQEVLGADESDEEVEEDDDDSMLDWRSKTA